METSKSPKQMDDLYNKLDHIQNDLNLLHQKFIPPILVDIKQASELIRISVGSIYNMIGAHKIPHYKNGSRVYFKSDELMDWAFAREKKQLVNN